VGRGFGAITAKRILSSGNSLTLLIATILANPYTMKSNHFGQGEILTNEQINSLFTHGLLTKRDRALFGVCLFTGCRINEACTLYQEDTVYLSMPRAKILIRKFNTKGAIATREIPTHPRLTELLTDYLLSDQRFDLSIHLFPGRGGFNHLSPKWADELLRFACQRIGLTGVSTHSFRRTCLTALSNNGIPLRHIQSISGHKTLTALQNYLGVTDTEKAQAIKGLSF
jgi:integrase/recombinase XerD